MSIQAPPPSPHDNNKGSSFFLRDYQPTIQHNPLYQRHRPISHFIHVTKYVISS